MEGTGKNHGSSGRKNQKDDTVMRSL